MELWEQSGESTAYIVNSLAGEAVKPGDLGREPEKPGKHCYEWLGGDHESLNISNGRKHEDLKAELQGTAETEFDRWKDKWEPKRLSD